MGGCFSGQKATESENAPLQPPASPKAVAAPTTESFGTKKEEPLVEVTETKEEVKKDDDEVVTKGTVAEAQPAPAYADEKASETVGDVKEESNVAAATSGSEDKASAAPAPL